MNIIEEIQYWVEQTPYAIAFQSRTGAITYKELWNQSDCIATFLAKNQTGKEPVVVYGHMEPTMIATFLGCSKAGVAYIPVDVSVPMDRLEKIIVNSKAKHVLVTQSITLQGGYRIVDIPTLLSTKLEGNAELNGVDGDDNYYIIYTSGSTGEPKGVQISHRNLVSFVTWMKEEMTCSNQQVFLNQAPFSFDLSVMDLYPCLTSGGKLVAIDKELVIKPKELFPYLEQAHLQVWTSTPSFVEMCLMNPDFNGEKLPRLHTFLFCGEILTNDCARRLLERFPQARVFNTYGPTEATVAFTSIEVTNDIVAMYPTLPVGYGKGDGIIQIVDEDGIVVEEGQKGEVILIGPSVSKGYLNNPAKTEQAFYTSAFGECYKTGDAGYIKNDLLFYSGRLDFQIKLHGYRIELEDIENNLCSTSYVRNAIIIPVEKDGRYESLTAVVIAENHSFEKEFHLTSAIKKELSTHMPAYMIPRKFIYVDYLPMTQNGKVDRKRIMAEVAR